ncbi:MAG: glycosyltransferase family 4 protein [Vicinamibacteria bacterium]
MKLAVWSPLPPSPSGIGDYVAEQLPALAEAHEPIAVVEDPAAVDPALRRAFAVVRPQDAPAADLDVYHLGNSPAHGFVYRAALRRPGVAFLHDFSLHHLVLRETVERGDRLGYLRQMRRGYGEAGSFVGRQVARALGGELLPSLFPLNERVLDASLAVVALSARVARLAAESLPPARPVLRLAHHLSLPFAEPPTRRAARSALGVPDDALVLCCPGLATASKRLDVALRVAARLRASRPRLRLVVAGGVEPGLPLAAWADAAGLGQAFVATGRLSLEDFVRQLAAADVVLALRFPSHGEMSGAALRALGVGRPLLVSAGTPLAEEFPEGVVVPVSPGFTEEAELEALLGRLLDDEPLRARIGALAASHVATHHGLRATAATLGDFLKQVAAARPALTAQIEAARPPEGSLLDDYAQELRRSARELGVAGVPTGVEALLAELAGRA